MLAKFLLGGEGIVIPPEYGWVTRYSGRGTDTARAVHVDSSGNIYTVGSIMVGTWEGFVAKRNAAGGLLWQRRLYLSSSSVEGLSVTTDSSGNVIAGFWGQSPGALVSKYDANGLHLWTKNIQGDSGNGYATGVGVDADGNIYATINSYKAPYYMTVLMKLDATGTVQWQRSVRISTYAAYLYGLATDSAGNSYCVGAMYNNSFYEGTLVKYDSAGGFQWARRLSSTATVQFNGVALDGLGGVYVAGYAMVSSLARAVLCKWSTSGSLQWTRRVYSGTTAPVQGWCVAYSASDSCVYIGGLAGSVTTQNGFVAKYDSSGTYKWGKDIACTYNNYDYLYGLAADSKGHAYAHLYSTVAASNNDTFLMKINGTGAIGDGAYGMLTLSPTVLLSENPGDVDATSTVGETAGTFTNSAGASLKFITEDYYVIA